MKTSKSKKFIGISADDGEFEARLEQNNINNFMNKSKVREKELIDRFDIHEVPRGGVWFRYGDWSILNCGELMKDATFKDLVFLGWEALKEGEIIRADSWEELEKLL